jgi:regulator of nucleoside diphosphate kinase
MLHQTPTDSLPRIIVGESEELRLSSMATAAELTGRAENAAKALLAEMARAHVVEDSKVPEDVVRMHSLVDFEIDGRGQRPVILVYPAEADISRGKISILTPIGAALIGLTPGQAMIVEAPDGKMHQLRVLSVAQSGDTEPAERNGARQAATAAAVA